MLLADDDNYYDSVDIQLNIKSVSTENFLLICLFFVYFSFFVFFCFVLVFCLVGFLFYFSVFLFLTYFLT